MAAGDFGLVFRAGLSPLASEVLVDFLTGLDSVLDSGFCSAFTVRFAAIRLRHGKAGLHIETCAAGSERQLGDELRQE